MKKTMITITIMLFICFATMKALHACDGVPGIAAEELNTRFAQADKNGDGKLDQTEFADYFVLMKTLKPVNIIKFCPKTGEPCEHEISVKTRSNVSLVPAKSVIETSVEKKSGGGCCGGGGCGGKKTNTAGFKAETIPVKSITEISVKKENNCCGK
ncbi:MAG: hypothetical protein LBP87_01890 [Planctomycetaceae bacterium]|jgi:hypothetical protein|nr:hypothetical protein [Planctomycetaceae bacterium]